VAEMKFHHFLSSRWKNRLATPAKIRYCALTGKNPSNAHAPVFWKRRKQLLIFLFPGSCSFSFHQQQQYFFVVAAEAEEEALGRILPRRTGRVRREVIVYASTMLALCCRQRVSCDSCLARSIHG